MNKIIAFFRRDFLVITSYRFRMALSLVYLVAMVFFLFFVGKTFSGSFTEYLSRYGNDYFAFALLGMSVSVFISTGLSSLAEDIRASQVQGTLESLLMTPTSPILVLFGSSLWSFVESFLVSLLYIAAAIVFLKISISLVTVLLVLVVLVLTFFCFLSLGMISAAFIMVFKQGNPINMIFGTSSYFLGGLLFPVDVLPLPLKAVSFILPITQSATALRELLLVPDSQSKWLPSVLYLLAFVLIAGPLGAFCLKYSLNRAKKDGSLVQF